MHVPIFLQWILSHTAVTCSVNHNDCVMCLYREFVSRYWLIAPDANNVVPAQDPSLDRIAVLARTANPAAFTANGDAAEFYEWVVEQLCHAIPVGAGANWRTQHWREMQWNREWEASFLLDYVETDRCRTCGNVQENENWEGMINVAFNQTRYQLNAANAADLQQILDVEFFNPRPQSQCTACNAATMHRVQRRIRAAPQILRIAVQLTDTIAGQLTKQLHPWDVPERLDLTQYQQNTELPLQYSLSSAIAHHGSNGNKELGGVALMSDDSTESSYDEEDLENRADNIGVGLINSLRQSWEAEERDMQQELRDMQQEERDRRQREDRDWRSREMMREMMGFPEPWRQEAVVVDEEYSTDEEISGEDENEDEDEEEDGDEDDDDESSSEDDDNDDEDPSENGQLPANDDSEEPADEDGNMNVPDLSEEDTPMEDDVDQPDDGASVEAQQGNQTRNVWPSPPSSQEPMIIEPTIQEDIINGSSDLDEPIEERIEGPSTRTRSRSRTISIDTSSPIPQQQIVREEIIIGISDLAEPIEEPIDGPSTPNCSRNRSRTVSIDNSFQTPQQQQTVQEEIITGISNLSSPTEERIDGPSTHTRSRTASIDTSFQFQTPRQNKRRRLGPLAGLVEVTNEAYIAELGPDLGNLPDAPAAPKKRKCKRWALYRSDDGLPSPSRSDDGTAAGPSNNDNAISTVHDPNIANNGWHLTPRRPSNTSVHFRAGEQYWTLAPEPQNDGTYIVNVRGRDESFHVGSGDLAGGLHVVQLNQHELEENPQRPGHRCYRPTGYQVVVLTYTREKLRKGEGKMERDIPAFGM